MVDINIGDDIEVKITDSASLSAKVDIADNSLLAKMGLKQMVSHTATFVAKLGGPVDQSGFQKATFGGNFSAPSQLIGKGTKLTIKSDVSGGFSLLTSDDKKVCGDDFTPDVSIAPGECWMCFEVDATITGKLAATVDGVGLALQDNSSARFATYSLIKQESGKFPSLQDALVTAMQNFSVTCTVASVRAQSPGTINLSDLKGGVKFSGSYSVPMDVNSLASASLPFNYKIAIDPSVTLKLTGEIALTGEFVVRAHRVSTGELRLGVYKKKGTSFTATFTAGAGVEANVADTDILDKLFSALFQDVDLDKVGISGKDAKQLESAIGDCVDHSLSLSLNASCSASLTDEAAVAYSIDLAGGNQQQTDEAIAAALRGDWTALAALSNATLLRNIFRETEKSEHKLVINLLGIYNAETVDQFVKSCTVLHDENGQVLITDKVTASHVAVASAPMLADSQKLRAALAVGFLATVAYSAGGSGASAAAQIKDFTASQTYFRFKASMSAHDMRQEVAMGKALKLIADNSWDSILAAHPVFALAKIDACAIYDSAAAMQLFYKDPAQRSVRSLQELEQIGRQIMIGFIDPNDPTSGARIAVLKNDSVWNQMDQTGAVAAFNTIPGLSSLSANELADVGVDWTAIAWWADAMSKVAPKISAVQDALKKVAGDFSKDKNFMKARAGLAGVLAQVTRNSQAAFAGGWGIAVMEAVSGFAAPVTLDISADGGIAQHYQSAQGAGG